MRHPRGGQVIWPAYGNCSPMIRFVKAASVHMIAGRMMSAAIGADTSDLG